MLARMVLVHMVLVHMVVDKQAVDIPVEEDIQALGGACKAVHMTVAEPEAAGRQVQVERTYYLAV